MRYYTKLLKCYYIKYKQMLSVFAALYNIYRGTKTLAVAL